MQINEPHVQPGSDQAGPVQGGLETATTPDSAPSTPKSPVVSPVVSVVATRPESVLEDIERGMHLAGIGQHLSRTSPHC